MDVGMLYWQLRNYSLRDIFHAIVSIPFPNLLAACLACLAGYFALALYDYLALNYVGENKKVSWWKWMLAGMLGFAISNMPVMRWSVAVQSDIVFIPVGAFVVVI